MSCRDDYEGENTESKVVVGKVKSIIKNNIKSGENDRLFFGVESNIRTDNVLQNNLKLFDWAAKNKIYPIFWGRNIVGTDCLLKEEIVFLHKNGCKIAPIYKSEEKKENRSQGEACAKKAIAIANDLGIWKNTAIFLFVEDGERITWEYMLGYARELIIAGYAPGFKANTDSVYEFDHEFCRGLVRDYEIFSKCLIWATAPIIDEYNQITNSHLIHPDNWRPFTPSGLEREDIAVWQYGVKCHPIKDDEGRETTFNINLVRNEQIIINNMF